jgi:hypothetical protein
VSKDNRVPDGPTYRVERRGMEVSGPGVRRRKYAEIQAMIDDEFRTPDMIKFVLKRCRSLGFCETVTSTDDNGREYVVSKPDPAYAKLFVERVMGPLQDLADIDLEDAPPEVVEWLRSVKLAN